MRVMVTLKNNIYFNGTVKTYDKETMEDNFKDLGIHTNFLHAKQLKGNNKKSYLIGLMI